MGKRTSIRLTAVYVKKAQYEGNAARKTKDIRWHTDPEGLGLRLYPSGAKAWVLRYVAPDGREKLMTLADYGVMTVEQAEQDARIRLGRLLSVEAVDPLADRKARKLDAETDTVEQLHEAWLTSTPHADPDANRARAKLYLYKELGERPWRTLTRPEVRAWLKKNGERSRAQANLIFADLSAAIYWRIFSDDEARGQTPTEHRLDVRNPCAGIKKFKLKDRQIRIEQEDWPAFVDAIAEETSPKRHEDLKAGNGAAFRNVRGATTDPYMRAFFHVLISLGCRKTELRTAKWENVRLTAPASITFRGTKSQNKQEVVIDRTVPLSDYALEWLSGLKRLANNPYIFCGYKSGRPLSEVNKAWDRIRTRAGFPDITVHDLRRTFGSWLGDDGFSEKQVGATLGHKSSVTGRVYMALSNKPKQKAVDTVGRFLQSHAAPDVPPDTPKKKQTNVIPLQRRRA